MSDIMKKHPIFSLANVLLLLIIMAVLSLSSLYNYLLFHSLAEIASTTVSIAIFLLAWNSRGIMKDNYLLFLGIGYLFVGSIGILHTLSYKGMGVFHDYGSNLPTQFWIAARYVESISLLVAPFFLDRKIWVKSIFGIFCLVTIALSGTIFTGIFPDCFIEGVGLTPFKKISEYIVSFILLLSIGLLYQRRARFDPGIFKLIASSIFFSIFAELAFTTYIDVYGITNQLGHFFKITSFFLIYKALIETGLREPYNLLFWDLKKSEETIRQSETRYRSLFENMLNGFAFHRIEVDEENRPVDYIFLEVNRAFERLTGLKRDKIINKRVTEVLPGIRESSFDWIGQYGLVALEGKELRTEQFSEILGRWHNISAYSPEQGYFAVIFEDITARKKHNLRLHSLLKISKQVLSAKTSKKMLREIVDAAKELTGARIATSGHAFQEDCFRIEATSRSEQTAPCPSAALFSTEIGGAYLDVLERNSILRLSEEELCGHAKWRGLPEANTPIRGLLAANLTGWDNAPRGIIMVSDKNEGNFNEEDEIIFGQLASLASLGLQQIEAREMAQKRAKEAEESRQKLDELRLELERSNSDLEQFASIVSHDLQEPLRTISGFVQLLSRRYQGQIDEKADTFIAYVVDGVTHMQRLLNDLLTFSRVGSGGLKLQHIHLQSALDRAMQNLRKAIDESGTTFILENLPVVWADKTQMTQLFQNLIGNAIKFRGDKNPVIHISVEQQGDKWIIKIRDNGIGIDPKNFERIFSIFQRLHRKKEYPGTGVGLAICKKIVERHGGRMVVESSPGEGTSFLFSLNKETMIVSKYFTVDTIM